MMRLRFRIDPEPTDDPLNLRWQARCARNGAWLQFGITLDLQSGICKMGRILFSTRLLGTDLARIAPGATSASGVDENGVTAPFVRRRGGPWKVLEMLLSTGQEVFLLGLDPRNGRGEIVLHRPRYLRRAALTLQEAIGPSVFSHIEVDRAPRDGSYHRTARGIDPHRDDDAHRPPAARPSDREQVARTLAGSLRFAHDGVAGPSAWLPDFEDAFDLV